jgi:hypothetical protein
MDATGKLTKLAQRQGQLAARRLDQFLRETRVIVDLALDEAQLQRDRDHPLLSAVVQVALDPPPLRITGRDDALTRGLQLDQPRVRHRL